MCWTSLLLAEKQQEQVFSTLPHVLQKTDDNCDESYVLSHALVEVVVAYRLCGLPFLRLLQENGKQTRRVAKQAKPCHMSRRRSFASPFLGPFPRCADKLLGTGFGCFFAAATNEPVEISHTKYFWIDAVLQAGLRGSRSEHHPRGRRVDAAHLPQAWGQGPGGK